MIGLRPAPNITQLLEAAARKSGVSLSQEAEARIARSFDRQDLMSEVMAAAYGRRAAGYLMLMGRAFVDVGRIAGRLAEPMTTNLDNWTENRWARSVALEALLKVFETYVEPDEFDETSKVPALAVKLQEKQGGQSIADVMARGISSAVHGFAFEDDHYMEFAKSVRPLLGIPDVLVEMAAKDFAEKIASAEDEAK